MKKALSIVGVCLMFVLFNACTKRDVPKPQSQSINKILPLGASRVEGARPEFESYRYDLWKLLQANHWTFDFVWTQSDPAAYPLWEGEVFDVDHEGHGGWTSGDILEELGDWLLETGPPDIVLLSSPGGNDGLEDLPWTEAVENVNEMVDLIQASNPDVTILIEQLAPGRSDFLTPQQLEFIHLMQQEVANISADKTTTTSQVIAVDMFTGFADSLLADDVHYNPAGAKFIADRYYNVLQNILTP